MHLTCHSYYSLRYGTLSPADLVAAALDRGIETLVLADVNSTAGAYPFWRACEESAGRVRPVFGVDFRRGDECLYVGIARSREGWAELCGLLTECSLAGRELPGLAPDSWEHCDVVYPRLPPGKPIGAFRQNEYLGVRAEHLPRLFRSPVAAHPDRLVAWSPFTALDEEAYVTHRLLRAIDHNTVLSQLAPRQQARPDERLYTGAELRERYATHPHLLDNAAGLIAASSFGLGEVDPAEPLNHHTFTRSRAEDLALVRKLAEAGCRRRYGEDHPAAAERLARELAVIERQGFCCYFLVTWDLIRYARSQGYRHVGRGSGANSIVAYCMYISDVDPLELDLYFERFINPHRSSPPDFDVDFSWDERDDVIDYVFTRYGAERVAMVATTITFKYASLMRELGKVFGLGKAECDLLVERPDDHAAHHGLGDLIRRHAQRLAHFPNYLSIHAGGLLIANRPLRYHVALQRMPKGVPVVQMDMYTAEEWGFHKYDLLSQRGLGHIKDAVDLVRANRGRHVDIHDVAAIKRDERVRARLRGGRAIGCFYVESPAMRGLLSKLGCDDYRHLVAASSIIRPGVAQSGMMRAYIERFHAHRDGGGGALEYLHPVFEEHLGETFGVMVYQEDVMKVAHHYSGLPLDECDVLRRIMSGKRHRSDTFERLRAKFFRGCAERARDPATTREVWRQVESFAGYSFCKAHSASFAVESFQSLWLKEYYPLEFMVAVVNNAGGFYRTEFYVHEARIAGARIHPPCVNRSRYLTTIVGDDVYLGFVHLGGLERRLGERIAREREAGGDYRGLGDFARRNDVAPEQLTLLIRIGALRFTGASKYELLWGRAASTPRAASRRRGRRAGGTATLFGDRGAVTHALPALREGRFDQAFDEIELLGFPLCSPFELLAAPPAGTLHVRDFPAFRGRTIQVLGYFVARKDVRTRRGAPMAFGTWLDARGDYFDTTHFPGAWRHGELRSGGVYLVTGSVAEDFGFLTIDAERVTRLPYVADERYG